MPCGNLERIDKKVAYDQIIFGTKGLGGGKHIFDDGIEKIRDNHLKEYEIRFAHLIGKAGKATVMN